MLLRPLSRLFAAPPSPAAAASPPMPERMQLSELRPPRAVAGELWLRVDRHEQRAFDGLMDPLVLVEHFRGVPALAPRPRAGIATMTVLFEDAGGALLQADSTGAHDRMEPGAVRLALAGRGLVHLDAPVDDRSVHGLHLHLRLPRALRLAAPSSQVRAGAALPSHLAPGVQVRLLAGRTHELSAPSWDLPNITLLDGRIGQNAAFYHVLGAGMHAWICALDGAMRVDTGTTAVDLPAGWSVALACGAEARAIRIDGVAATHFVLAAGLPVREPLHFHGQLVAEGPEELEALLDDYSLGRMGAAPVLAGGAARGEPGARLRG